MVRMTMVVAMVMVVGAAMVAHAAIDGDRVYNLPGWSGALPSRQFSGYLDVGAGRHLHYWFSESTRTPATDPVVIWMNGGPGCSSLDGMFYEMGQFHFVEPHPKNDTPKLYYNQYTWITQSNMIFLEAPACVGLSYADTPAGCHNNDTQQAIDNLQALRVWYQGFPEYRNNALYITGESYAGVYVPTLAAQILTNAPSIPLKGIAVGNGVTGNSGQDRTRLAVDYLHGNGLFSTKLYTQIYQTCGYDMRNPSAQCDQLLDKMGDAVGHVNIYDIFGPCINDGFPPSANRLRRPLENGEWSGMSRLGGPDACIDAGAATVYLNRPEVRQAINARPVSQIGSWQICTDKLNYDVVQPSLLPVYRDLLIPKIKVLIYNGQGDACVPWNGNEEWTSTVGGTPVEEWRTWLVDEQVAGYVTNYRNGFSFLTVKAAGHMVPQTHPRWALEMFDRFINNKPY